MLSNVIIVGDIFIKFWDIFFLLERVMIIFYFLELFFVDFVFVDDDAGRFELGGFVEGD